MKKTKIIQITNQRSVDDNRLDDHCLVVLCEDGTLWKQDTGDDWWEMPLPPNCTGKGQK